MSHDKEKDISQSQKNVTDPQENEKDGNVFGPAFDKTMGDSFGGDSASDDAGDADEMPVNNIKGENRED